LASSSGSTWDVLVAVEHQHRHLELPHERQRFEVEQAAPQRRGLRRDDRSDQAAQDRDGGDRRGIDGLAGQKVVRPTASSAKSTTGALEDLFTYLAPKLKTRKGRQALPRSGAKR
jgi:hypothetical protein